MCADAMVRINALWHHGPGLATNQQVKKTKPSKNRPIVHCIDSSRRITTGCSGASVFTQPCMGKMKRFGRKIQNVSHIL